ncbi:ParA family protein [Sphingobacterium faecium]|uniref:ParA family protein n=1 Tax=Sphingobacterium faecium TaxID=34087 RepID=UPI00246933F5|nr:ParA family protein [Sphingobacterium faecium]MDH5828846.1 ParA family protein [Sphingobacterium faecium]WGQ17043.1 ParA family protein [Sphingobacterium faecium]
MIITFGTQKGGVGKTTLAIAFANYISLHTDYKISVLDFDFQKSFFQKWKDDEMLKGDYLYDVVLVDEANEALTNDDDLLKQLKDSEEIFLFDIAGNIQKKYSKVLKHSNFIVVPFSYSDVTINSTLVFVNLCKILEIEGKMLFVRNNVDKNGKYLNQIEMDLELQQHGKLLDNSVFKRNCLQTITTKKLTSEQKLAVKSFFDELIFNIREYGSD